MKHWSILLLLLGALGTPSSMAQAAAPDLNIATASSSNEEVEKNAIFAKIRSAIAARNFAELSTMESKFRSDRTRMPSGVWKLAVLHAGLQYYLAAGLKAETDCRYSNRKFVQDWEVRAPGNPAPAITDAALLLKQGWCNRGAGYAQSVAAEAWPRFRAQVNAALAVLKKHKTTASIDPEFYAVEVDAARAEGIDRPAFHALLEEAIARERDYHRTYFNAVWYYLPQWNGSYKQVGDFARYAVERTRAIEGSGLYARIFWSLDECGCRIIERAADWNIMRRSMQDVYVRHPNALNAKYFADVSCRMKDINEGRQFIRAMHPETTDDGSFGALFAACDNQARSGS